MYTDMQIYIYIGLNRLAAFLQPRQRPNIPFLRCERSWNWPAVSSIRIYMYWRRYIYI